MKSGLVLAALALAVAGCGKKDEAAKQNLLTNNGSGNPLTAPVDYLGAVNQAKKAAVRAVDLAPIQQAIQLFHAQEDRYPKDLAELARARYIQQVPELPAGSRFAYNPATGDLKIVRP